MSKYSGFNDYDDMLDQFEVRSRKWNREKGAYDYGPIPEGTPTDDQILIALYGGGGYDGTAIVIYEKDGKLYEVNGSHCSCYGLEDQWDPEETSWEALAKRKLSTYEFGKEEVEAFEKLVKDRLTKEILA